MRLLDRYSPQISALAARYPIPEEYIRAVVFKEMTELNVLDLAADAAVSLYWKRRELRARLFAAHLAKTPEPVLRGGLLGKKDSSVGWAQIYAFVAIDALNFALGRGLCDNETLGLPAGRRFERGSDDDLCFIWRRLRRDRAFNLEMCALNLLAAAEEMTGRIDFDGYAPQELKLVLTRYNGRLDHVTPYGEETYGYCISFKKAPHTAPGRVKI